MLEGTQVVIVNGGPSMTVEFGDQVQLVVPQQDSLTIDFSISQFGSSGPQGPKGDKGDTGDQGPQGIQGIQGPQGVKGDKGDTGDQGPIGPTGDTVIVRSYAIVRESPAFTAPATSFSVSQADGIAATLSVFIGGALLPASAVSTASWPVVNLSGVTLGTGDELTVVYQRLAPASPDSLEILLRAQGRAKNTTLGFTGSDLTSLTYSSGDGYTSHGKTLSYSGGNLSQTVEAFTYSGAVCTLTTTLSYSGGNLASTSQILTVT